MIVAQRDYVRRAKGTASRRKNGNSSQNKGVSWIMIAVAAVVLVVFVAGLMFIAHHNKISHPVPKSQKEAGNGLPPKPEERWRYIKELENRKPDIPVPDRAVTGDNGVNPRQLTDEQRQLLEQMQADMRQPPVQLNEVPWNGLPAIPQQSLKPEESTAPSALPAKPAEKKTPPAAQEHWLVQCGSFKNAQQAESVRVQLAFEGFVSQISVSDGWQRVIIGPFNTKPSVDAVLNKLKANGHSQCIRLKSGG